MNDQNNQPEKSTTSLREEATVSFWKEHKIFEQSVAREAAKGSCVFYDGPPFATGLPHYGHILGGTGKDVFARYKTMNGYSVPRKWGWDCHGLPIETIVEKSLGIKSKKEILEMGIDAFSREARSKVLGFVSDWKKVVDRTGRWANFDGSYKTMNNSYIESVWWALSQFNDKGLVYEGVRVLPYCTRCQTPLAKAEIAMDNSYKDITDISVYVTFALADQPDTHILAWTTTPWTLPGNTALAVNPSITYVKVSDESGKKFILARDRFDALKDRFAGAEIVEELSGEQLVGLSYVPMFDYFANDTAIQNIENGYKIYAADYVTVDTGTGIVHIAPVYGEEDMALAKAMNIPFVYHVGMDGVFSQNTTDFAGNFAKPKEDHQSGDVLIIKKLAEKGVLFAKEKITHSYPHCYRCETPILYYALPSWFIRVSDELKAQMLRENDQINWVPGHLKEGRFKHVIETAPDWNISRNRFWASPLPIWKTESGKVVFVQSIEEMRKLTKTNGNSYFFMRHGQADSNVASVWNLDGTDHLTEKGIGQVVDAAKKLELQSSKPDVIICSPFTRTHETAKNVALYFGIPESEIVTDIRLKEWFVGSEFQGKNISEFSQKMQELGMDYYNESYGDGESFRQLVARTGEALYEIEQRYQNKNILIVGHSSSLRAAMLAAKGVSQENCHELDAEMLAFANAEVRTIEFTPLPHNEYFEIDLHKPYIDQIQLETAEGESLTRIPEVIDCWFESGSMPFAQDHYPFERPDWQVENFPGQFVVEYIAQTRTWFYYTLLVSTVLFGKTPFRNVVTTGNLNGTDGRKMSKSLGNYPDPMLLINKYGTDALRLYLMSSVLMKGEDSDFLEKAVDDMYKRVIGRLGNVLSFYQLYRDTALETVERPAAQSVLNAWMLARLDQTIADITEAMERYDVAEAVRPIDSLIDDLSTWYVRRSREVIKDGDVETKKVLYYSLREIAKILAPFAPFMAEHLWQELSIESDQKSVHLADWPTVQTVNETVLKDMENVRSTISSALELRARAGIKVRQPLGTLTITTALADDYVELILDEVNVKSIVVGSEIALDTIITEELRTEGALRDIIRAVQQMRKDADLAPGQMATVMMATELANFMSAYPSELEKITVQITATDLSEGTLIETELVSGFAKIA